MSKAGLTLMEIIIVVIIIGIAVAVALPNFLVPNEQARALNARNNLLAIYSAQKNYFNNNNNAYCVGVPCGNNLVNINSNLSLNIQDDGTYTYACAGTLCTATRATGGALVVTLDAPIQLTGGSLNPRCTLTASWCP